MEFFLIGTVKYHLTFGLKVKLAFTTFKNKELGWWYKSFERIQALVYDRQLAMAAGDRTESDRKKLRTVCKCK